MKFQKKKSRQDSMFRLFTNDYDEFDAPLKKNQPMNYDKNADSKDRALKQKARRRSTDEKIREGMEEYRQERPRK